PSPGEPRTLELPAALAAGDARELIARTAKREAWARETLAWRSCELDPAVAPGAIVTVPDQPGRWRVSEWEWRASGIDLTLTRLAPAEPPATLAADPGQAALAVDVTMSETVLAAFELPWDGSGSGDAPALFAAASSSGAGWRGAALYLDAGDGELQPLTTSGRERSILGTAVSALAPASPLLFDRSASIEVALVGADMALSGATPAQLGAGANRALLGGEVLQFGRADPLGGGHWRLSQLLRGRGGTEAAVFGHGAGERFVLLDGRAVALDPAALGANPDAEIAALGLGDTAPVESPIACRGITLRPLSPVHGRAETVSVGGLRLAWTRRARGAYAWRDGVDIPLQEETEAYLAGYGPPDAPLAQWETDAPTLTLDATTVAALSSALPGGAFHVRQRGRYAVSEPLIFPPA
ncbi:MAG: hypothetical protein JF593_15365, partial [Novosphingobium sp.]|nr:hypothetical protein [Novosphingobium sp.]